MKRKFKRVFALVLAAVMTVSSMLCTNAIAQESINNDIPEGLPEGAYKVYEGIYAVDDNSGIMPLNNYENINIGTVPASGTIVQPAAMSRVIIDSGDKWLCIRTNAYMRINFVYDHTSVFGANYLQWPAIGTSSSTTYYIDVEYYGFIAGEAYAMQCTSGNGNSHSNVIISLLTTISKREPDLAI